MAINDINLLSIGYTFSELINNDNIINIMKEKADKKMYKNKIQIKKDLLIKNKNITCFR